MTVANTVNVNPQPPQATALVPNGSPSSSGVSFQDVIDTVNPLQHIPVISGLYRAMTGSSISSGAQVAGDAAYGMLLGGGAVLAIASSVGTAAVNAASTQLTGSNVDQNIVNALSSTPGNSSATPLVPDSGQAAIINAQVASQNTPQFMSLNKHPAAAAAQYQYEQATIEGSVQKKLVQMV